MGIGTSIFLIAAGAILRWGVADAVEGINLSVIGLILIICGILGLVISLLYAGIWSRGARGPRERTVVRDRDVY